MPTRRHFLAGLATAAAATWIQSARAAPDPKKNTAIGHGKFRYKEEKYLETLPVPGRMVCHPIIAGSELYAGVCWSKDPGASKLPGNPSGFTEVLDASGKVVSAPGGTEPVYSDGTLSPLNRGEPVFEHGHDVCVLENGDLVVCQWNAQQTYPIKLERLG